MYIIDEDNVCKQSQEEREIHIQTFVYEVIILYLEQVHVSYSCSPESTRVIKLIILTSGEWMYTKNAQQYFSLSHQ